MEATMYFHDVYYRLQKLAVHKSTPFSRHLYCQKLLAKMKMSERFYLGDISGGLEAINYHKLKAEHTNIYPDGSQGHSPAFALAHRLPFPITYIDWECPHHLNTGTIRYSKGAVLFHSEQEKYHMADCFFYFHPPDGSPPVWHPDGNIMGWTDTGFYASYWETPDEALSHKETWTVFKENGEHCAAQILLSMLLGCKNIEPVVVEPSRAMNRKRVRRGEEPILQYKVLKVRSSGKSNGAGTSGDGLNALHLCRGHFKTFTEEKPLLGKHTGRYWWQAHARGNRNCGLIEKEYDLTPVVEELKNNECELEEVDE